ncbi:MAG: hypothetical protein ACYDCK_02545 [Thermoplasmatota archaeon]
MTADYQEYLQAIASIVTLVLTLLSLTAYRSTRDKRILLVTVGFLLWTLRLGLGVTTSLVLPQYEGATWAETTSTLLDTAAPIVIFLALVKREKAEDP